MVKYNHHQAKHDILIATNIVFIETTVQRQLLLHTVPGIPQQRLFLQYY